MKSWMKNICKYLNSVLEPRETIKKLIQLIKDQIMIVNVLQMITKEDKQILMTSEIKTEIEVRQKSNKDLTKSTIYMDHQEMFQRQQIKESINLKLFKPYKCKINLF